MATPQNLLRKGSDWLADQLKANASSPVLYARGSAVVAVQAVIGRTDWAVDTGSGPVINEVSRDFIVLAADLVLPGVGLVVPQRGDKITDGTLTYEVMAPSGQQVWRWSDPFGKAYRIHTKKVPA
jgi:hypothetical protein